jgi:hypothetical protein
LKLQALPIEFVIIVAGPPHELSINPFRPTLLQLERIDFRNSRDNREYKDKKMKKTGDEGHHFLLCPCFSAAG